MPQDGLVTVFGGTGFLGRRVVRHLLDAGHRVRIAARHPRRRKDLLANPQAEAATADLFEPETLRVALEGATGAVNATSLYVEQGDMTFEAVHIDAAGRLARLAGEAGARHFVQMSGIGVDPDADDRYIRARAHGESAVCAAFSDATLIRPSAMFGSGDALISAILRTARHFPVFPLFGRGQTRIQPVHVEDVALGIATLLDSQSPGGVPGGVPRDVPGGVYEFAGPRVLTYRQLVSEVLQAAERSRPLLPVPFPVWQAIAAVAEYLPGAPLTRSQIALVKTDNVAQGSCAGLGDLDITPTDITEFVRRECRGESAI
ncbi:complex I NDUFA9 subunit family protein [Defluviimonas sp. WL0002]|uniref:Complex I NDUFA9 subunit family protein n=1 Tax=Albidovulum marisflavi TaxID=2984159 RepID=A0ABT2ZHP7_9RHOB|nr:complex I NDUFA9 subunit family protein [Defluviimonas sp. WL0002]MCV2870256.1 complex I NDUFA9 subunit family protein [Defluviimonas sp. WL0002]